jgi:DNA-binding MarR family transcriptional regulator
MPAELDDADYRRLLQFRVDLRRFLHWSEEQAEKAGLTPAQHQLLLAIRGHGGAGVEGPTIGDVAGYLLLRHHSAVGLVDRAVKAGLVERREDPVDRRVVRLSLSALGSRTLEQLSELHLEEMKRLAPRIQVMSQGLEP